MKTKWLLFVLWGFFTLSLSAQPTLFYPAGVGGGGGLFSPAINPADGSEYYLSCDLGALFHTENGGQQYVITPFTEVVGGVYAKVCFTADNDIRYVLKWDEANYAMRPAKSSDAGQSWEFLSGDSEPWEDKFFIYADYQQPQRLVWSTYSQLWISTDGGQSDHLLYTAATGAGLLLSGVYFDGDDIYFGTNEGVLLSTDGGQSVASANYTGIPSDERIMGFGAGSDGTLTRFFALTGGEDDVWAGNLGDSYWGAIRGVYTMDNMSGQWTLKLNGINTDEDFPVFLAMAENDPNTCYLAGATITPYAKPLVMKTSDGGDNWQNVFLTENNQNIFTGYQGYQGDFDYWWGEFAEGFTVNPFDAQQAILTDLGFVHMTTDGGASWHQRYTDPNDEHPPGAPTPKQETYHSVGLEQTSLHQIFWFDEQNLFACFTDIRGIRSTDGGQGWSFDYSGHELNTMYHIVKHETQALWFGGNSQIHDMYETTHITDASVSPSWKEGKVLYTTDKGANWHTMKDFGSTVFRLSTDPNEPEVLYAAVISADGDGGIWKATGISSPTSANWTQLPSPGDANLGRPHDIHVLNDGTLVTSWGVRQNNGEFLPGSGVFVSSDGGQSWENRSHQDMRYWTQDLLIDPFDEAQNTWYACVWSGWGGPANDLGRLWRTTDRGNSWQPMTLPQQFHRVSSVTIDPNDAETMYLTTETEGLWVTHNKSAAMPSWELVEAYPYHAPRRVFFNPYVPNEIWIASFGGGMMHGTQEPDGTAFTPTGEVSLSLYPNPSTPSQNIRLNTHTGEKAEYRILNTRGESLQTGHFKGETLLQALPPGLYFVEVKTATGYAVKKWVVR